MGVLAQALLFCGLLRPKRWIVERVQLLAPESDDVLQDILRGVHDALVGGIILRELNVAAAQLRCAQQCDRQ